MQNMETLSVQSLEKFSHVQGAGTFHQRIEIFDKFLQEQRQDHFHSLEHHHQKRKLLFPDKEKTKF